MRWGEDPEIWFKEIYLSNPHRYAIKKRKPKMINRITIVGRVLDYPKLVETGSGFHIVEFPLSFVQGYGDNQDYAAITIKGFGKKADDIKKTVQKGFMIGIDGNLFQSKYQNKDGEKRYRFMIIAQDWQIFSKHPKGKTFDEAPIIDDPALPEPQEPVYEKKKKTKDPVPEDLPF